MAVFIWATVLSLTVLSGPILAQPASGVAIAPRLDFSSDEMALALAVADDPDLAAFYGANRLRPVFSGPGATLRRQALVAAVSRAAGHGLPPARYRMEALLQAPAEGIEAEALFAEVLARWVGDMSGGVIVPSRADRQIRRQVLRRPLAETMADFAKAVDPAAYLDTLAPRDPRYLALQKALSRQAPLVAPLGTPKAPTGFFKLGARDDRMPALRARLAALGFPANPESHPAQYDAPLAQAVMAFQKAAGLPPDGIAGPKTIQRLNTGPDWQARMIMVALERMRWMGGHDLNARHVWVNIPEFTARIYDGGQQQFITRVVVGKTDVDQRTPEFSDEMEYVVVNPRWNVPASITANEYLPRLQQNRYAVPHLDVVDRRGNVISRDRIDFAKFSPKNFPYRLRQQPSGANALGLVKFIFPNRWNIYLHDTPSKSLFGKKVRTFSHGCVRVGDPFDLAYALLSQQTKDPRGVFRRALNSGRETYLELRPHLPVHLVYFTAFPEENGQMRYYNDVYDRDAKVWRAMQRAALEPAGESD